MAYLEKESSRPTHKIAFIFEVISSFFVKVFKAIQKGQEEKANRMITDIIIQENPNESYDYILKMVRERKADEFFK